MCIVNAVVASAVVHDLHASLARIENALLLLARKP
jgi:hypothetical protein